MRTWSTGKKGFTLVELLVVVVIICVLAGMTVPRMYTDRGKARLQTSARRMLLTAQYARDFAATRRSQCRLMIDTEQQRYALAFQEEPQHNPNEFVPVKVPLGRSEQLAEGLRFAKVWIERRGETAQADRQEDYICFEPTGQADAAAVEITDGQRTCSLLVAPSTGYAKIVEGSVNELPNDRLDLDE